MFLTVVLISGLFGIVLVVATFISMLAAGKRQAEEADDAIHTVNAALQELDNASDAALHEINDTAALIMRELEEKYQSLLFLYTLLDEKKQEITNMRIPTQTEKRKTQETLRVPNAALSVASASARSASTQKPAASPPPGVSLPGQARRDKIKALHHSGLSVSEIAKRLHIGQGEVKLILDLEAKMES